MKKFHIISVLLILIFVSCNNRENDWIGEKNSNTALRNGDNVLFSGGDGVSVLIFHSENGNSFKYEETFSPVWDAENKAKKNLLFGNDYKFIFYKAPLVKSKLDPALSKSVTFEQVKFSAQSDGETHVLPVDEIWLPDENFDPDKEYTINGFTPVKQRLTRAVSQIELHLKRGIWDNGNLVDSIPYPMGENIMNDIRNVSVEVDGVGEAVDIDGGIGKKKMIYTFNTNSAMNTPSGFAVLQGPFVFPAGQAGNAILDFTVTTSPSSGYVETMTKRMEGPLERNKKLKVTLWFGSAYRLIDVTYELDFISEPIDGDDGTWE